MISNSAERQVYVEMYKQCKQTKLLTPGYCDDLFKSKE